jgi:hypothetical protein
LITSKENVCEPIITNVIKNQLDQYEVRFKEICNQVVKEKGLFRGKQIQEEQKKK